MFSLTTTHLRFVCEAVTPLRLEAENFRAGSNLRGALGQVMLRTYCAGDANDPQHAAHCPVHWLLAAKEMPGEERRGYALVPPLHDGRNDCLERGEPFEFGLTLFGSAQQFLPYFVLAVPEMGRLGVGPGRGKFVLKRVWALNPLTGESQALFSDESNLVKTPTLTTNHEMVLQQSAIRNPKSEIAIEFLTPMRLIEQDKTVQVPGFQSLFARLLKRADEVNEQFAGGARRAWDDLQSLQTRARRVQLTQVNVRWVEVFSGSNRRGVASPISGFVGSATYAASPEIWRVLLPWLVWGELLQVGKDTVKGNGVMRIAD